MQKVKRGSDGLTRKSHRSKRAHNGKGDVTESLASVLENMRKTKRGNDDLTRSHKSRSVRNAGEDVNKLLASLLEDMSADLPRRSNRIRRSRDGGGERNESGDLCENFNQDGSDEVKSDNPPEDGLGMQQFWPLDDMGYPMPTMVLDDDMILVNTFEETFGDIYPKGVWRELSNKACSNIDRYVVALASFDGSRRSFSCTGFFIEWNGSTAILTSASLVRSSSDENNIDENLRIEVLLPNKWCIEGTLQHYSLHYNVALISVKHCRDVCPANVQHCQFGWSKVAAVGCCFESGELMATSGNLAPWSGTLDCPYIVRSTCKITKAGIGGPLVNMDGEVLGMNFYDRRIGTPFLFWSDIDNILSHFRGGSKAGEVGSDSVSSGASFWKMDGDHSDRLSRWPVPMPCWRHREDVDKDKTEDELVSSFDPQTGRKKRYSYILGVKVELY